MVEPIRVLDGHHRPGRSGRWIAAVVVAVVVVAAVVILASSPPRQQLDTTVPGSLAAPVTEPPAPTTTLAPQTLAQLVPGFQGQVRAAAIGPELEPAAWTWSSGEATPRQVLLPGISLRDAAWDFSHNLFAAISEPASPILYAGTPARIQAVADRALSFAWHVSEPAAIAYTTSLPDGATQLWTSPGPPFSSIGVAELAFEARLVGYGDWGFALADFSPQIDRELLITLDPQGQLIATAPLQLLDASADGVFLVKSALDDSSSALALLDVTLAPADDLELRQVLGAVFSPSATWAAVTTQEGDDAILHIRSLAEPESDSFDIRLGPVSARPVAWSGDLQWVLLVGMETTQFENQLVFADLANRTIYTAPFDDGVFSFALDSIAGSPPPVLAGA